MHSLLIYYIYTLSTLANSMMKWLTYDLESTFLRKGFKRTDTLIIEIALYGKHDEEFVRPRSFQRLVNPLQSFATKEEVIESLHATGQNPEKSINFWTKLLAEKKLLGSHLRRAEFDDKAAAISSILTTKAGAFVTVERALKDALAFGSTYTWIAHNGKAFDQKIVEGNCAKLKIDVPVSITFKDSLPLFRSRLPGQPSYSQPILYKSLFKSKYMAHHALEDAKALHKMVAYCITQAKDEPVEQIVAAEYSKPSTKKRLKSDLLKIKGIGQGSLKHFMDNGIKSQRDLQDFIETKDLDQWYKTFHRVYAYKKLGAELFSGNVKLE